MSFANIFSHPVSCLSDLLIVSFNVQIYFHEVPIVHFCFCFPCLQRRVEKLLQLRSKEFLHVFSSRIFMISCPTFRSFIHFEVFLVYCVRKWFRFIFLHVIVQFSLHHLLKILSLFHWIIFPGLSKISWPYILGPFLGSLFSSIDQSVCSCASNILS